MSNTKEITLSDGRKAVIRKGKGRDLIAAINKVNNENETPFSLVAELTEINGKKLIFEDFIDMDLEDFMAIMEGMPLNFLSVPKQSSVLLK